MAIRMSISTIYEAILELCKVISNKPLEMCSWKTLTEEELLHELTVCLFSSQNRFDVAVDVANSLKDHGCLNLSFLKNNSLELEEKVNSHIIEHSVSGFRFQKRLIQCFSKTISQIYGNQKSIISILNNANNSQEARIAVIENICGFGPKQSSLFLRRIHYSDSLAVLDTHIIDYLNMKNLVCISKSSLNIKNYMTIENIFIEHANQAGYSAGCFDLATWITMRVAKKEGYSCVL